MLKSAELFYKAYTNLPIEERKNTIIVLDEQPISWLLAYEEINNKTEKARKIIKILKELNII